MLNTLLLSNLFQVWFNGEGSLILNNQKRRLFNGISTRFISIVIFGCREAFWTKVPTLLRIKIFIVLLEAVQNPFCPLHLFHLFLLGFVYICLVLTVRILENLSKPLVDVALLASFWLFYVYGVTTINIIFHRMKRLLIQVPKQL